MSYDDATNIVDRHSFTEQACPLRPIYVPIAPVTLLILEPSFEDGVGVHGRLGLSVEFDFKLTFFKNSQNFIPAFFNFCSVSVKAWMKFDGLWDHLLYSLNILDHEAVNWLLSTRVYLYLHTPRSLRLLGHHDV